MDKFRKIIFYLTFALASSSNMFAQNYNEEKIAMTNFILRMYKTAPFEGVKVFTDYNHTYLLSVLSLEPAKYSNVSVLNRVAGVKAMSQASRYFNGSKIDSDLIVRGVEHSDGTADSEIIETIREKSAGYVKALELLTSFDSKDQRKVFIYCKEIVIENNN